ncbi:MAG TPA: SBBP repeat-containing protein [Thermoanaerobaculia bacterium]|nr:SBBP repeat-containing protein [Thermoanaerobaculia bacterium]
MKTTGKISGLAALTALLWLGGGVLHAIPGPSTEAGLVFSTFLGGSDRDEAAAVAVGPDGGIHVTGATASADFPVAGGQGNPDPEDEYEPWDAFLARLAPDGSLTRSTYLPDDFHDEFASDLALGPGGEEHAVGWWTDIADDWEIWISTGTRTSTPYYGESIDHLEAVAVTPDGGLLVAGSTCSQYFFGTDRGWNSPCAGFLATWSAGGTFLGTLLLEGLFPEDVAVDPAGFIYVAASDSFYLPNYEGSGRGDVRVVKLDPSGHPLYSVRLGGSSGERPSGIALDAAGNAYVTGQTESADFPVLGGVQGSLSGARDAFVAKIDPSGVLVYSTYLGGAGYDSGRAIAVDALGSAALAGTTGSPDFPVADPIQGTLGGGSDAFVARLNPSGTALTFASYLGGSGAEEGRGLALNAEGDLAVVGWTESADFPTRGTVQSFGGQADVFVTVIRTNQPPDCSAAFASPSTLWPPNGRMVPVSIRGVTDPDGEPVELRVTAIHQDEPLSKKGQPDSTGLGTATPALRADRAGNGDGRVYHIAFEATDPAGAACSGTVTVCVPHDRGKPACGDGGMP